MRLPLYAALPFVFFACTESELPLGPVAPIDPPAEIDPPPPAALDVLAFEGSPLQLIGFSADGGRLAFAVVTGSLQGDLYLYDLALAEARLIDHAVIINLPFAPVQLSEDGERILYRRALPDDPSALWVYEAELFVAGWEGPPVKLGDRVLRGAFRFAPGAARVVWVEQNFGALWMSDLRSGAKTMLAAKTVAQPYGDPVLQLPMSPDGRTLARLERTDEGIDRLSLADLETGVSRSLGVQSIARTIQFDDQGRVSYAVVDRFDSFHLELRDLRTDLVRSSGPGRTFVISASGRFVLRLVTAPDNTFTGALQLDDLDQGTARPIAERVQAGHFAFVPGEQSLIAIRDYGASHGVLLGWDLVRDAAFEIDSSVFSFTDQLTPNVIAPDGRHLVYTKPNFDLVEYDLVARIATPLECSDHCDGATFADAGQSLLWQAHRADQTAELHQKTRDDGGRVVAAGVAGWSFSPDRKKGVLDLAVVGSGERTLRAFDWSRGTERDLAPLTEPGKNASGGAIASNTHAAYVLTRGYGQKPSALFVSTLP